MQNNPVCWFEIYVQDMARARTFYEKVFAFELQKLEGVDHEMWTFPMQQTAPGITGSLVKMEGCAPGGNSTLIYFACADCDTETKLAAENGGKIIRAKFSINQYGFIALINDSEGNMIGLHSMQ